MILKVIYFLCVFSVVGNSIAIAQKSDPKTICILPILKTLNPPVFPGGLKGWKRYLQQNIDYPLQVQNQKIQGNVWVQVIIDSSENVVSASGLITWVAV